MTIEEIEDESKMHGCCYKNKLSICLAFLVVILTVLLVIAGFLFLGYLGVSETEECTTSACIKASAEISDFIDESIDPCEDFYSFVCGNFENTAYEKQISNLLNAERTRMQQHLDTFIVEPVFSKDHHLVKMQKTYFQSCLDEENIDEDDNRTLLKKLSEIGEWPLLRQSNVSYWDEQRFDWMNVMIQARAMGLPFEWFLKVDLYDDDDTFELQLSHPENCGRKLTDEYFEMQTDILEQFTVVGVDTINVFNQLRQFEEKLNSICLNTSSEDISLKKLSYLHFNNVGTIHFLRLLTSLKWNDNPQLAFDVHYINELNRFLNEQPKTVQANYILWKIVEYFAPYLSKPIRERYWEYINGIFSSEVSRFQFCLEDTQSKFKYVSEIVQLQNYVDSPIHEEGPEFVYAITDQISDYIESANWRNNQSKEPYLDLYGNLEVVIGGTEEMFEDDFLLNYLDVGKVGFFPGNIIQMISEWSRGTFFSKMKMIGKPAQIGLDFVHEANSQYVVVLDEDARQLILPPPAFDSFLYNSDRPQYLNYAGLGTIIAEELVTPLMKPGHERYIGFEESRKCFDLQDRKSNASRLFFMNYKSLLAQEFAYRAYQSNVRESEEMPLLNLDYTPNQLFWIKSNLNWCYHALPEEEDSLEMQEMFRYRIIQGVRNSASFASDFNCSSDAPMNPNNKCPLLS